MSNLRDLLGIVSEDTLKASAAPDDTTKIARLPSEGYCVQYITAYCGATCQEYNTNYYYMQYPNWCAPDGVCDIIFGSGAAVEAAVLPAAVHEAFLLDLVHMHTSV